MSKCNLPTYYKSIYRRMTRAERAVLFLLCIFAAKFVFSTAAHFFTPLQGIDMLGSGRNPVDLWLLLLSCTAVLGTWCLYRRAAKALDARVQAVEHFSATGQLDPNANIQFGEGGAGTFSDGKLTTRIGDELCDFVTEVFLQHGAPAEIAWKQKPHVGTDLLRGVITSIRKEIESLGGEVHFNTALTGLERKNGRLVGITTTNGSFACETLVFAVGHSARSSPNGGDF